MIELICSDLVPGQDLGLLRCDKSDLCLIAIALNDDRLLPHCTTLLSICHRR